MDFGEMLAAMGLVAWMTVGILFLMSIYIIMVGIERFLTYKEARKQSKEYVSLVAESLKKGNLEEAFALGEQYNKSHLAKVLTSGLKEMEAHGKS